MTTGVKIVSFNVGDTTITLDTHGYVPAGILFFGAHQGSDYATRFWGCSDGSRQWSMSQYTRSGVTSPSGGMTGLTPRSDYAITMLTRSGTAIVLDAAAKVTAVAVDTITLHWDHAVTLTGSPCTAVVFFGTQFSCRAGIAFSAPSSGTPTPYYVNTVGFQPDCVFIGSAGGKSFGTVSPYKNVLFGNYLSLGWGVWPIPAYEPPQDSLTGHAPGKNQRYVNVNTFYGDQTRYSQYGLLSVGVTAPLGNYSLTVTQLATGFGLAHSAIGAIAQSYGYFAIKWTTGRFTTGVLHPGISDTITAYDRFGGTYNSSGTDTDPSGHANPSAMMFTMNNLRPEVSLTRSNSLTIGWADSDGTAAGYAYGGGPNNTGAYNSTASTQENVTQLSGGNFDLLGTTGTSPVTSFSIAFWDGDGITVTNSVVPPSASFYWPYLAMTRDDGWGKDELTLSASEASDTFLTADPDILANRRSITTQMTEQPDTMAAVIQIKDGAVLSATEEADTWVTSGQQGGIGTLPDSEFIYVPEQPSTLSVPVDLPIIQQSDVNLTVDAEDRVIRVYREDRAILVPPVEEGAYV